jgi:hypothetical protein
MANRRREIIKIVHVLASHGLGRFARGELHVRRVAAKGFQVACLGEFLLIVRSSRMTTPTSVDACAEFRSFAGGSHFFVSGVEVESIEMTVALANRDTFSVVVQRFSFGTVAAFYTLRLAVRSGRYIETVSGARVSANLVFLTSWTMNSTLSNRVAPGNLDSLARTLFGVCCHCRTETLGYFEFTRAHVVETVLVVRLRVDYPMTT